MFYTWDMGGDGRDGWKGEKNDFRFSSSWEGARVFTTTPYDCFIELTAGCFAISVGTSDRCRNVRMIQFGFWHVNSRCMLQYVAMKMTVKWFGTPDIPSEMLLDAHLNNLRHGRSWRVLLEFLLQLNVTSHTKSSIITIFKALPKHKTDKLFGEIY